MKFSELKKQIDHSEKSGLLKGDSSDKMKNLELILNVVNNINKTLVLEDVLQIVLRNAIKITNSDRGFIVLKNPSDKLEFKLGLDVEDKNLTEEMFNVSTSVVRDVFESGQSKFIEGAQSDTNYDPSKSILRLELQTILCSCLITDEKKIGVLYVDSKHLHKINVKEITDTFEILAGQAATAIKNAQLYKGQLEAYNALNEANVQLIQAERKTLKSSIDSEIGQSLQGLVHMALLETESLMRTIEKTQKQLESHKSFSDSIFFDRLKLKSKVAIDSVRNIQKYAQILSETAVVTLNKEGGELNKTIQSVIKYLSPMKKFSKIVFETELNTIPVCKYDSEQIQHVLVHLFTNSADVRTDATIVVKTSADKNKISVLIEDNGPGFPDTMKNYFSQIISSEKSSYGLYLCKSIIDRHNGEIKVNKIETGASVQFSLPLN
ncbi:MAG TPA: GAF domain-containing sensor histidine kinase [Ignavibacteriaceae bacterium]|nr:GAF domain-containing sensor histidine kinase [Ignavibacteriaceae bacterium]